MHLDAALLAQIFDGNPDPVTVLGTDFRVLLVNEALRRLFRTQLKVEVEPGASLLDLLASAEPSVQAAARENWARVFGGESFVTAISISGRNGGTASFEMSYQPLRQGDRVVAGVNRLRDVTARARAEAALRGMNEELERRVAQRTAELAESEDRYRSLFELSADAIVAVDLEGRFTEANAAALALLGYSREELLALRYQDITPRRWDATVERVKRELPLRGVSEEYEKEYVRKDGSLVPLRVRAFVRNGRDGARTGTWAILRDITDRKRAEEALLESEERFRTVFETSPDVITLSRLDDGVYAAVNATFARVSGWSPAEAIGRSTLDLAVWVDPEDRVRFVDALRRGGTIDNHETRFRTKSGREFPALISARLIALRGEPYILSTSRDITAWREAERERERLAAALQQAAKMEAIGQLAGGVAHDFNNLLTVVLSGVEALRKIPGCAESAEIIEDIGQAGARARDLTSQLLAFARRQVSVPVPLALNAHVDRCKKMLGRLLGEDVQLVTQLAPDLWTVRCDPGQLDQVILNLAVNARHAMPLGGTLVLETSNVQISAEISGAGGPARGDYVRLRVRDSGEGMTAEVKSRIFEPFFTTKATGRGTGLGLATVYGIVKQNEGNILVDSEPGRGTVFDVLLPRTAELPRPDAAPRSAGAQRGLETVLVVEDDPKVRAVTARCLRAGGYGVLEAESGEAAIAVFSRAQARPRLLVTDVVMPGMHGCALADELKRKDPGLRVLFVSGYAHDIVARRGALDASVEFLPKPFTAETLLERVRAVLDAA